MLKLLKIVLVTIVTVVFADGSVVVGFSLEETEEQKAS